MDIVALKIEDAAGHPDTGAYDLDNALAAIQYNAVNRTTNKSSMTGDEILNQINAGEWGLLSDADKQTVWDVCHLGKVDPFGVAATLLVGVFDAVNSPTITALKAARKTNVSRAVEIGLGKVIASDVMKARM